MRVRGTLLAAAAALLALPAAAHAGQVKAGGGVVDASWHVGASAGQYASDGTLVGDARRRPGHALHPPQRLLRHPVAPAGPRARGRGPGRQARRASSRTTSTSRRTCSTAARRSILEAGRLGHHARAPDDGRDARPLLAVLLLAVVGRVGVPGRVRRALLRLLRPAHGRRRSSSAAANLGPCAWAPRVVQFDKTQRHSFGPAIADDGTPAGYPNADTDHDMTVVRFDDVSNPAKPKPLANARQLRRCTPSCSRATT